MAERFREKWSREETILAFDLYCKTSFSKISKTNKDIIALAELLGRTPSSVGLKMANLAHYDPELIARNVKGMSNTSKLDKEIVEAQILRAKYAHTDIQTLNPEAFEDAMPDGMDVQKEMKIRLGQYFFRLSVLNAYGNSCCITGIQCPGLLIASHIKPWSVSDSKTERTNPRNGLCLNSLHDKAFDKGLITILIHTENIGNYNIEIKYDNKLISNEYIYIIIKMGQLEKLKKLIIYYIIKVGVLFNI